MSDEYNYLTDEELEALIGNVEEKSMIAPPVYLKQQIMEEIRKEKDSPPVNTEKYVSAQNVRKKKNLQLLLYSAKIITGAAAAIICITVVPFGAGRENVLMTNKKMEISIEKDAERYREEKRRLVAELEADYDKEQQIRNSRLGDNDKPSGSGMTEIVNKILGLFGTEEENDE